LWYGQNASYEGGAVHSILLILGLLACPLMMLAMGGIAWFAGKLGRGKTSPGHGDHSQAQAVSLPTVR
jgi:hypothetical protein